jgi:diguanylate cyclase (GGDEF)-like protein
MRFGRKNKWLVLSIGLLTVAFVTLIDYWTYWDISLSLFYSLIVCITSYYGGIYVGGIIAIVSAVGWTGAEILSGLPHIHWYAPYWNWGIRSAMFYLFAHLTVRLQNEAALEKLARTDPLTGVWNRRYFYELVYVEMKRAGRYKHAFTMIYMDLDDFKAVNDALGHRVGDELLQRVAQTLQTALRTTDCIARLGGDEFAILLSQTGQESAASFLDRVNRQLLAAMRDNGWNVTFSIGATTYIDPPNSVEGAIGQADHLMYSAKRAGKAAIKHEVFRKSDRVV